MCVESDQVHVPRRVAPYADHRPCWRCSFPSLSLLPSSQVRQSAVNAAAERGHLRFVAYLLKRRADPRHRSNGNTAILVAASHGHIDIVKHLLDHPKVDIDSQNLEDGRTPLIWAVDLGNIDLLKLLLTEGANFYFRDDVSSTC